MTSISPHLVGTLLILGSTLAFSMAGLFVRWVDAADGWQMITLRCASLATALLAYSLVTRGRAAIARDFRVLSWRAVLAASFMCGAMIVVIWAFRNTTIANVVFFGGATPFITSLLAWLILGERVRRATVAAMVAAFAGVAIMTWDGLGSGTYIGDFFALAATLVFSSLLVSLRAGRDVDMLPVIASGAIVAAMFAASLAPTWTISWHDVGVLVAMGGVQTFLSYLLLTLGARRLPAADMSLFGTVELVIAPALAWLIVAETPSLTVLAGGIVILGAVLYQAVALRRSTAIGTFR